MTARVDRVRMAMKGNYYSYDVTVPLEAGQDRSYLIVRDGKEYLTFADATLPDAVRAMPLGWDRYEAYKAHEEVAKVAAWELVKQAFPEVSTTWAAVGPQSLFFEIPGFDARHDTKMVEVSR